MSLFATAGLGSVIDEAAQNIIPVAERNRTDLSIPYGIAKDGISRFITEEMSKIRQLLDGD